MQIEVRTPAEVSEVSRALQRANQRRLADRQADGWAERDAVRLARRAQALASSPASRRARTDPWRGAVPEFPLVADVRAHRSGKRFKIAGGYIKPADNGVLQIHTADKNVSRDLARRTTTSGYQSIVLPAGSGRMIVVMTDYDGSGYAITISKTEIKIRTSIPSQLAINLRRLLNRPTGEFFTYLETALLEFFAPGDDDYPTAWVWTPLLRSYGYGHLVNRDDNGQTPGWGWTPIVFSFLRNYKGEFHRANGDTTMMSNALSYEYIRDNYIPNDVPEYFVTADVRMPDATVDTTRSYYYFKAPSTDRDLIRYTSPRPSGTQQLPKAMEGFSTQGTPSDPGVILLPNRGEYTQEVVTFDNSQFKGKTYTQRDLETEYQYSGVGAYETPIAAWDWDRPLACWIELINLGFTPDDLMLSEEEQQALSEADPAEAGFKF
jgi:hypothetical protein